MEVKQIYAIMNSITNEMLGESIVVAEDLSNIVELGQQFESVVGLDNYVRKLPDHIGRVVFVDRKYEGRAPQILMDGWEYFEIDMPITRKQVKSSFDSVTQLNSFLSMILNAIETSLTVKLDALIMRTINKIEVDAAGSDVFTVQNDRELYRHGNIGIQSATDLLKREIELRQWNYFNGVFNDIEHPINIINLLRK